HQIRPGSANDRRPDPTALARRAHGLGATTSAGAGFTLALTRQLALGFDGAACSITTDGVAQPQFPVRGALSWSGAAPASDAHSGAPHASHLSFGAGTSWLPRPSGLRAGVRRNLDWSVSLEYPWSPSLSFVAVGEHESFTS